MASVSQKPRCQRHRGVQDLEGRNEHQDAPKTAARLQEVSWKKTPENQVKSLRTKPYQIYSLCFELSPLLAEVSTSVVSRRDPNTLNAIDAASRVTESIERELLGIMAAIQEKGKKDS
ncbi:hypothetical protein ACJZ2D_003713 [Fusarium nematophilum]